MKVLKFLNVIFVISLIIILVTGFNKKTVIMKKHHFICLDEMKDNILNIKYKYYYDLYTDQNYKLTKFNYVQELKYKNKKDYDDSKKYYLKADLLYASSFDDKDYVITLTKKLTTYDEHKHYFKFIKEEVDQTTYKCEEIL